ncbi:LOW QUALITY PROTEIN: putative F-box/kelch-repeat protein At3g17280, partial [Beta vulgaris subsp. vulgaris]|uniref:LOW QUALITY PROTEIN: putative F-box/kelch-repeat protein At3g17280 n=1 Tax=Beta vulgaris subsp. vulgaris TaxID=3555 RepID=UPI0025483608
IVSSILSRLPTKTCLNCKLVCKEWYGIIISPEFADVRSSNCSYTPIMLYGVFEERMDFMVLDIDRCSKNDAITSVDSVVRFRPRLSPRLSDIDYTVVNECNGLVLLASWRQWDPFVICNLLTGEQVTVEQCSRLGNYWLVVDGLGCCTVSRQFKVLRILQDKEDDKFFVADIQTLGSNEWRAVEGEAPLNFDTLGIGAFLESGAFLHGSLHRYSNMDNSIWSFHFSKEKFCQVPTLDNMKRGGYKCLHVFDNSCLVLTSLNKLLD